MTLSCNGDWTVSLSRIVCVSAELLDDFHQIAVDFGASEKFGKAGVQGLGDNELGRRDVMTQSAKPPLEMLPNRIGMVDRQMLQ